MRERIQHGQPWWNLGAENASSELFRGEPGAGFVTHLSSSFSCASIGFQADDYAIVFLFQDMENWNNKSGQNF